MPHSDIHGSKPARGSPWLIAACHVLHRLLVPRHPPNALLTLRSRPSPAGGPAMRGNHRPTGGTPFPPAQSAPTGISVVIAFFRRAARRRHPSRDAAIRAVARNASEPSPSDRGRPRPPRGGTRPSRSDIDRTAGRGGTRIPRRRTRPETHQNLIHPDKEQRRRSIGGQRAAPAPLRGRTPPRSRGLTATQRSGAPAGLPWRQPDSNR